MAKQVIVLGKSNQGAFDTYDILLWLPVSNPSSQRSATGSQWTKASVAENAAIQSGAVLEERTSVTLPAGLDTANVAAVQAVLLQAFTERSSQLAGNGPNEYNGVAYDPGANGWQQY